MTITQLAADALAVVAGCILGFFLLYISGFFVFGYLAGYYGIREGWRQWRRLSWRERWNWN